MSSDVRKKIGQVIDGLEELRDSARESVEAAQADDAFDPSIDVDDLIDSVLDVLNLLDHEQKEL